MNILRSFIALTFALFAAGGNALAATNTLEEPLSQEWNFRVLLNDKPIGFHRFRLAKEGDRLRLESNARFDVRFLVFNAYRYRHSNREVWNGSCLESMETDTSVNGDDTRVVGEFQGGEFVVDVAGARKSIDGCVMTFAYWDPSILDRSRLLNAQTGDYLNVEITAGSPDTLTVRGRQVAAQRFRISAQDMQIDVWYSPDKEWLGLESLTESGRVIRYELT